MLLFLFVFVLFCRLICRFESEYDLKGRLGKGGFGVVYHVQNKTDGGEYALKRIKLPLQRAARDKVMREVRALAQLDHPRIVRYYNSWVEKVSQGWSDIEEHANTSRRSSISMYVCRGCVVRRGRVIGCAEKVKGKGLTLILVCALLE